MAKTVQSILVSPGRQDSGLFARWMRNSETGVDTLSLEPRFFQKWMTSSSASTSHHWRSNSVVKNHQLQPAALLNEPACKQQLCFNANHAA